MAHFYEVTSKASNNLIVINLDLIERIIPENKGSTIWFQGETQGLSVTDSPSDIVQHWLDTRFKNL